MKNLIELDPLYKVTISKLEKKERLIYCENLIDSVQNKLIKPGNYINIKHINLYFILSAAQEELKNLQKTAL